MGGHVKIRFRRPTNNQEVEIGGEVVEMLAEGGLWRGRAAMRVRFDAGVDNQLLPEDAGAEIRKQIHAERRGAQPSGLGPSPVTSLGGAFTASGRGRRRRPPAQLASEALLETMDAPPVAAVLSEDCIPSLDSAEIPDRRSLREQLNVNKPPARARKELANDQEPAANAGDPFFGRFQADGNNSSLPPILDDSEFDAAAGQSHAEDMLATSTQPQVAGLPPVQDITAPFHAAPAPGPPATRAQAAVTPSPNAGASDSPPWEAESDDAARSFIPRHIRIASSLEVTFWSRGRQNKATAQNFSREGAFLAFDGDPPIRGAIVRVEFPIDWSGETLPVRFNAEVRWHRADRPGATVPEGFGVQILTFESPKDQGRYDEMLVLLLNLDNSAQQAAGQGGYRWGAPTDRS